MEYGLIGRSLLHSYSPEIHAVLGDYDYALRELSPEELPRFLASRDFKAVNVTIPYKETVMAWLDEVSPSARAIGAVNTIVNRGGKLRGDNTDLAGMLALLERLGIRDLAGKKVLILGTGGTSKTACAAAGILHAGEILRVSRSVRPDAVSYEEAVTRHRDARLIINTTPVGMFPRGEECPLSPDGFDELEALADAVYNPLRTELVLSAQERGIPSSGGLFMLAAQAVYAAGLFFDRPADSALIDRAYRAVLCRKQNIVLIGMPSSGKTTVGRALAERLGLAFADTDEIILQEIGMPIRDYFARYGEAAFRDAESRVIRELSARTGTVIATGGGAILRRENVRALKRNGRVIFLDRDPGALCATEDRPLSSRREQLLSLYEERYPRYQAAADMTVDNNGGADAAVNTICGEWMK